MEEDEEDLGSDSQANDDLQKHENNLNRENSLKVPSIWTLTFCIYCYLRKAYAKITEGPQIEVCNF